MKQDDGQAVTGLDHYVHAAVTFHVTPVTLHGRRKQGAGLLSRRPRSRACQTVPQPLDSSFATVAKPFLEGLGKPFLEGLGKAFLEATAAMGRLVLGLEAPHKGLGRGLIGQENHHHDGDVGLREALRMGHEPTRFANRFRAACFFKHAGHVYSSPCRLLHVGVRQHRRNGIGLFSLSSAPARVHAGGRCRVRTKGLFCWSTGRSSQYAKWD